MKNQVNGWPLMLVEREAMAARIEAYGSVFGEEQFVNADTGVVEEFVVGWRGENWPEKWPQMNADKRRWFCVGVLVVAAALGWLVGSG